ncbi:DUF1345 domain-containing protein [Herbiconiux moechotypicola]|nr:DUF1345 domain-containing protein [Herbiconiux moechotypicola]MCS5731607.1 DUF1345 domain-containing protein [Herbiconiux moechotypicola]
MTAARAGRRVPVFAHDIPRSLVAMVPAVVVGFGLQLVALGLFDVGVSELSAAGVLLFWGAYCVSVIVITLVVFGRVGSTELARRLRRTAPPAKRWQRVLAASFGAGAISWAVTGSSFAILAVIYLALNPQVSSSPLVTWSAVAAVAGSWAVTMVSFAVHIARHDELHGGAEFPGETRPLFGDYLYLAAQIGTTFGGSDVDLTSRPMRRVVMSYSIIAFTFNTVIVALLVSVLIARVG